MNLSQTSYLNKVVSKFSMETSKPASIPLGGYLKLSSNQCPSTGIENEYMIYVPYSSAVGFVMYTMICTGPDMSYAISVLSKFMANPGRPH